ncbi:hypothetical protein EXIGLDRAFT_616922 [Exidia glandulosa HHB12029]|uniref:Uncharacterized protein n=1 Tax=Exidia glandulosa HHB12029 TaxID=1314781 RepID=A0A165GGJ7_EXIGL|nr:hypothetical protein EXIGLDRAFT_627204 [Exidia glandulosa HHB12029]KZV90487.1 hypothetical protein EXIGLDRAFT_616922 [Exidia glandulosa HHB12029]
MYSRSLVFGLQMTHLVGGPTISLEEARRIETVSLIVDLDQTTIVHATVDPTVGEWIYQGSAWEFYKNEPPDKTGTHPSRRTRTGMP